MPRSVVTTWFGAFLVESGRMVRAVNSPLDPGALADRARARRKGELTPEEISLLAERGAAEWTSRDRRLEAHGVRFDPRAPAEFESPSAGIDLASERSLLLAEGTAALAAAWDPSIHVQEAVRAATDLDRVKNLVGERLGSWVSRDRPEVDPGDHARAARTALEESGDSMLAPTDESLTLARRRLAELYRSIEETRSSLTQAVEATSPTRTPNLCALLGPELAARLVAQAGGLDRLARLPSSTVQVLGAEKAFFEHLRGRAPPPRHGILFVHPALQSAPRGERGKLARALAGKVAIAARLDRAGTPVNPSLFRSFDARRADLKSRRGVPRSTARKPRSRLPLDGAARDG
jgi:nucleolar protein 56